MTRYAVENIGTKNILKPHFLPFPTNDVMVRKWNSIFLSHSSYFFFFTENESGDSEDSEEDGSGSGDFEDQDPEIDRLFEKV